MRTLELFWIRKNASQATNIAYLFYINIRRYGLKFLVSRSRVPGILGTQARGNANFIQDRGNAK